jgi:ABC-type amino acid transport substrate-binding protein
LANAAEPLKIGLAARSMPCTIFAEGQWRGSFYEAWGEVAVNANLPFEVVNLENFRQLLQAGQAGQVDVAVGCVNMTPDRLAKYRFSVPIQEDGISVLVRREAGNTFMQTLRALWSLDLLGLLSGILAFVFLIALVIWRVEGYHRQENTKTTGRPRTFTKLFQILLTGPGTNVIATTVRGNGLIGLVYFVRIVAASVLVSFVSVNIIKRSAQESANSVRNIQDLAGHVVSAGTGSVSEQFVETYNVGVPAGTPERLIKIQQIDNLEQACAALIAGKVDAVVADNSQIQYYLSKLNPKAPLQVAIRNIHRQSQGLIFAPQLPAETALKINQAIARLKENGTIDNIKKRWIPPE